MPRDKTRRATTLSISLTTELAAAVNERVASGLYGSASELLREALRRLLSSEAATLAPGDASGKVAEPRPTWPAIGPLSQRMREVAMLHESRPAMLRARLRTEMPDASEGELDTQLATLLRQQQQESDDPHLRPAPERLRRILGS